VSIPDYRRGSQSLAYGFDSVEATQPRPASVGCAAKGIGESLRFPITRFSSVGDPRSSEFRRLFCERVQRAFVVRQRCVSSKSSRLHRRAAPIAAMADRISAINGSKRQQNCDFWQNTRTFPTKPPRGSQVCGDGFCAFRCCSQIADNGRESQVLHRGGFPDLTLVADECSPEPTQHLFERESHPDHVPAVHAENDLVLAFNRRHGLRLKSVKSNRCRRTWAT
jgi:hypothetical protein